MSFISNALGINNGFAATSGAAPTQAAANAQQTTDINNLNSTFNNQSNLAQQLQAQANGQGPNIANLQLQQATNQNNQQAAGAIASQRGMNPALAQRLISQQAANNNQQAAGQSGVLRAQQQLAAQQGLANVYGQQNAVSQANYNTNAVAGTAQNQQNAQIAQNNNNQNAGLVGGLLGGASALLSEGGEVDSPEKHLERLLISIGNKVKPTRLAGGGFASMGGSGLPIDSGLSSGSNDSFNPFADLSLQSAASDPMAGASSMGPSAGGGSVGGSAAGGATMAGGPVDLMGAGGGGAAMLAAAKGGKVPVMLSPGELKIPAHEVDAVASGKKKASEAGERVPGKAKVKGDSEKNDTFPTLADGGDVIIKRTKAANDKDAREFLLAIKNEKAKKNGLSGYAKVLEKRRQSA